MHESSAPSLIPSTAEAWTADLNAARSLTLIVHGVGDATSEGLLRAASDGYIGSDLGGISRGTVLADCPTLTGGKGVDSLVIQTPGGSQPLNYINRVFPKSVQPVREFADTLRAAHVRWINLWRRSDPIGKFLDIGDIETVQYCVEHGGHPDYWSGGVVWKAVAFEALGIGTRSPNQIIGAGDACALERRLGLLVFASVVVLVLCGFGLWNLFP